MGRLAYKTYIKGIGIFIPSDDWVEVASGWFTDKGNDIDLTRLE